MERISHGMASATYSGLPSLTSFQMRGTNLMMATTMMNISTYTSTRPSRCFSALRSIARPLCMREVRWPTAQSYAAA